MKFNWKQYLAILFALLLPIIYKLLNKGFYLLVLSPAFLGLLSDSQRAYLSGNIWIFDAVFCVLMTLVALPLYRFIKKDFQPKDPVKPVSMSAKKFLAVLVVALGVGGLTVIWQLFARNFLMGNQAISSSISSFDSTFTTQNAGSAFLWSFLSIAIAGPIVEEVIFRGILFRVINIRFNGIVAALVSGLYFGLWHMMPIQVVYTAMLGIVLGLLYYFTDNLWFPLAAHLINNISSTLPPEIEAIDFVPLVMVVVKLAAIIPMIVILVKMYKKKVALATPGEATASGSIQDASEK